MIHSQPTQYQCGCFALKYCLLRFGIFKDEKDICKRAGTTWWYGTDENGLTKASKDYNFNLIHFMSSNSFHALKNLSNYLKQYPCILSIDKWSHWICVIKYVKNTFVVMDSSEDKVFRFYTGKQLLKRWGYKEVGDNFYSYDGYFLRPKFKININANFDIDNVNSIDNNLRLNFGEYFEDIFEIAQPITSQAYYYISFKDFVRRYGLQIVNEIVYWHGDIEDSDLNKILERLIIVSEIYNLVVYEKDFNKAIIQLTSLLTLYACGKSKINLFYKEN